MYRTERQKGVTAFDPAEWDALAGGNPFVSHAFLTALERTGCVGGRSGWRPLPVAVRDTAGRLAGAAPLYLKTHSLGEFVFDWGWAEAAHRAGHRYYPKLVAAVPFSPVSGPRLLVHPEADPGKVRACLIDAAEEEAAAHRCGSVQWLFTRPADQRALEEAGYLRRRDVQFHWYNRGYGSFEDFLADLSSAKRKQIRRERRRAGELGLDLRIRTGDEVSPGLLEAFHAGYAATTEKRGAPAYLNAELFRELGRVLGDRVVLVTAERGGEYVAGALSLRSDKALYGRYWSAREEHDFLHFEVCLYRGIELAIAHGLERFEGGAQGEHKLTRGFVPTYTASAHRIAHPGLSRAVADFLEREAAEVQRYAEEAAARLPFRDGVEVGVRELSPPAAR